MERRGKQWRITGPVSLAPVDLTWLCPARVESSSKGQPQYSESGIHQHSKDFRPDLSGCRSCFVPDFGGVPLRNKGALVL